MTIIINIITHACTIVICKVHGYKHAWKNNFIRKVCVEGNKAFQGFIRNLSSRASPKNRLNTIILIIPLNTINYLTTIHTFLCIYSQLSFP